MALFGGDVDERDEDDDDDTEDDELNLAFASGWTREEVRLTESSSCGNSVISAMDSRGLLDCADCSELGCW